MKHEEGGGNVRNREGGGKGEVEGKVKHRGS